MPRIMLLLLLAILLLGCGPALVCPAHGGPPWRELTSPHYILTTDLPDRQSRSALQRFEEAYDILARFAFQASTGPLQERIQVVHFRNGDEYHQLAADLTAGHFIHNPYDPEDLAAIAMYGDHQNQPLNVLLHELSHFFTARYLPNAPRWLNEGLATYYETTTYHNGKVIFGHPRADHLYTLTRHGVPSLRQLFSVSGDNFYRDGQREINYAGAWLLVHFLNHGVDQGRPRFFSYLNALASGEDPRSAWRGVYPQLVPGTLEDACRRHLTAPQDELGGDFQRKSAPLSAARTLSDAEVHLVWEQLRGGSEADLRGAMADLDEVLTQDPGSAEARYRLARRRVDNAELVVSALREALASHPQEPRYWHALLRALLRETSPPASANNNPSTTTLAIQEAVVKLTALGRSARSLNTIAFFHVQADRMEEGLAFARRAVEQDPACWACRDTLARIYFKTGALTQALFEQRIAVNLQPDGQSQPALHERLQHYLQAVWTECRRARSGDEPSEACRSLAELAQDNER